jgi:hypothetical protein
VVAMFERDHGSDLLRTVTVRSSRYRSPFRAVT